MAGRAEALSLARSLMRAGRTFPDYNMRECVALGLVAPPRRARHRRRTAHRRPPPRSYIQRRVMLGFREHAALQARFSSAAPLRACLAVAASDPGHRRRSPLPLRFRCRTQGQPERLAALEEARQNLALVRRQVRDLPTILPCIARTHAAASVARLRHVHWQSLAARDGVGAGGVRRSCASVR